MHGRKLIPRSLVARLAHMPWESVMHMFRGALVSALIVGTAWAQPQTNTIVEHYRGYVTALERGDLETAEREAEAALAVSLARDGDGGRTAILALNLATIRLMKGETQEAIEPAQRAFALSRAGAAGVDPALAELTLARVQLATGDVSAAAVIATLLENQASDALPAPDVFAAATELGASAMLRRDFETAQLAWSRAASRADGAPLGQVYGASRAKTLEAVAIISAEIGRNGRRRIDRDEAATAYALLSDASRALYPFSVVESPSLQFTIAQRAYAEARVWLSALEGKLRADRQDVPETPREAQGDADGLTELGPVDLARPRCMMRVIARPLPDYPNNSQVAGIAVFLRTDEAGTVVAHEVAAQAGSERFAEAVEAVAGRWRVERIDEQSVPNCRMQAGILQIVQFFLWEP